MPSISALILASADCVPFRIYHRCSFQKIAVTDACHDALASASPSAIDVRYLECLKEVTDRHEIII
jgi:hypothetical protein